MGKNRRSKEFRNNSQVIDMEEARKQRLEKRRAEKEKKEEKILRAQAQNTRGKRAIRKGRNRKRLITALVVAAVFVLLFLIVMNIVSLKKEQHDVKNEKEALEREKARLSKELEQVDQPENIEQQARDQLRLIKPGETLYLFPDEMTEDDKTEETTKEE